MTDKKIILIYPGKKMKKADMLPLGILSVGAYALSFGYDIQFLDMRVDDYNEEDFKECSIAGFSVMTGNQIGYALKLAGIIRKKNPGVKLVWGGVHATILPEETVNNELVDVVVKGEGELVFKNLIDAIVNNQALKNVKGICFRDENGEIVNNSDDDLIEMDTIPFLPYEKLKNIDKYGFKSQFPYQISRGCPGRCTFCFNNQKKGIKPWRSASPEKILKDIEEIVKRFNPEIVFFIDDQALLSKPLIRKVAQTFIDKKYNFKWFTSTTFNCFASYDEETIQLLKNSGLFLLKFGGESGSTKILKDIKKAHSLEHCYKALNNCKKYDIDMVVNFMMGFEDETQKDLNDTFDLIDDLKNKYQKCNIKTIWRLVPYPGTEVFEQAARQGYVYPKALKDWDGYGFTTIEQIPWLKPHDFKKYNVISNISRYMQYRDYTFHFPKSINDLLNQILYFDAKMRWKFRFFDYGFEWVVRSRVIQFKYGKGTI